MGVDKINARNWELLMYAVEEKRVVPIIGDNLIRIAMPDGECVNVREYVLKKLSEHFESDTVCKDYSQVEDLIREYNRRQRNAGDVTDIYSVPISLGADYVICAGNRWPAGDTGG